MAFEYKPRFDQKATDPSRCKASVSHDFGWHQCPRKPWQDGWCKQHHPETETKRRREQDARYEAEAARRREPRELLAKAQAEIVQLKARIAQLEDEVDDCTA